MNKKVALNALSLSVSLLVGVTLAELTLRLGYPKYQQAADAQYDRDAITIWSPRPNRRSDARHPDTGASHAVIYNALALRQSRQFANLDAATNIAFFGDSYTANLGLPVQHSFTEPLDYLLSLGGAFNVLNFGVNGYGTDQAYLRYVGFDQKHKLDHVFYVLCANDLRNIYESALFSVDSDGRLVRTPAAESPWWIRLISRLHLTYLALDVRQRVLYARTDDVDVYRVAMEQVAMRAQQQERFHSPQAEQIERSFVEEESSAELTEVVRIFVSLLHEWRDAVQADGGQLHVVLLPTGREELFRDIIPSDIPVISLYELFESSSDAYRWSDITFRNDGHWAERGNMLAALHLYRYVEKGTGLPLMPEKLLRDALRTYYAAFPDGWMPDELGAPTSAELEAALMIRAKYLALERR
jgi:hypothetical protein